MIKKLISKLFGIKQCACPEDEHIDYYTKVPEQDEHLEIYEETAKQKKIREKHKGETE